MKIEIEKLQPHPLNHRIYGYTDCTELIQRIKESGWIKPILITQNNTIISGHRRVEASKQLGIKEIEFEYVMDDYIKQLELFVNENCFREKTTIQKTREASIYLEIEKKKAYQRKVHSEELVETFPQALDNMNNGKSRDIVAEKVGLSGRTLDKALKVMNKIDSTHDAAINEFFEKTLDVSVEAASKLASNSDDVIHQVIEMTEGDPRMVSSILNQMNKEKINSGTPLPPGKYQIIELDMTRSMTAELQSITISEICEPCSLVFLWALPHQLEEGIMLIKSWGFRYTSCLLWKQDNKNEISTKGELCLIGVQGSPNYIFKDFQGSLEKPLIFKEIIDRGYPGWSRVEIKVGEGWEIW